MLVITLNIAAPSIRLMLLAFHRGPDAADFDETDRQLAYTLTPTLAQLMRGITASEAGAQMQALTSHWFEALAAGDDPAREKQQAKHLAKIAAANAFWGDRAGAYQQAQAGRHERNHCRQERILHQADGAGDCPNADCRDHCTGPTGLASPGRNNGQLRNRATVAATGWRSIPLCCRHSASNVRDRQA